MEQKRNVAKTAIMISSISVITLLVAFIKESVFAAFYGASDVTDAYTIAIQIPTTLFAMISMAISNVALPYYSKKLNKDGSCIATRYISNLMTIVTILSVAIVILIEIFAGPVIRVLAPGLNPNAAGIATDLFRLILPTIILTELFNINTAVQNVHKSFFLPSLSSILLHCIFISSVVFMSDVWGIQAAVFGTVVGTICEFGYSVFLRRKFVKYTWVCDPSDKDIILSVKRSVPVFIGLGVAEINKTIDTLVSSFLDSGSISMMSYASKLSSAVSTLLIDGLMMVIYPEFAECAAEENDKKMADYFLYSIRMVLLLLMPVVIGGAFLDDEIITIVYKRGAFSETIASGTAPIFTAYLVCLIFRAIRQSSSRVFYSYGDTKTPMRNSIVGLFMNTILDLALYQKFGAVGIAWATTGTYAVVTFLLIKDIKKRNQEMQFTGILHFLTKVIIANAVMICGLIAVKVIFEKLYLYNISSFGMTSVFFVCSVLIGACLYIVTLFLMKINEVTDIAKALFRRKK